MATGAPPIRPGRRSRSGPAERWSIGQEGAKGALLATVSTIVVFGLIAWAISTSSTWPLVRERFFSGFHFRKSWPVVLEGFWLDLKMFAVAEVLILVLSLVLAVMRSLRGPAFFPLRVMSIGFIDLFRGAPLYLVIILLGFGVPALQLSGVPNSVFFWGVVATTLSYSAYTAEVYRSGIDSVHPSQRAAARSLGLTQWQAMRYAVLPQAIRNVVPALLNGLVSLQKDVALVGVLGIRDAVKEADIYKARSFNFTPFVVATVLFLLVSVPLARFTDWYTARDRRLRSKDAV